MRRTIFAGALALLLCPALASAQAPDEERRAELFKDGVALANKKQWADAAIKFREVIAIRSAPKALVALALAEENLGHLVAARDAFRKARVDAGGAKLPDVVKTADKALEKIEPRVPLVTLKIPEGVENVGASVDGETVVIEDGVIAADPGERKLVVEASGRLPFRRTLTLVERDRVTVDVVLTPSEGPAPPPPPAPSEGGGLPTPPLGAAIAGGAGLVLAGVGVVFIVMGKSQESDLEAQCPDHRCPYALRDSVDVDAPGQNVIVGDVVLGLGAAGILAGAGWWWWSARSPSQDAPEVSLRPLPGGGFVGLSWSPR